MKLTLSFFPPAKFRYAKQRMELRFPTVYFTGAFQRLTRQVKSQSPSIFVETSPPASCFPGKNLTKQTSRSTVFLLLLLSFFSDSLIEGCVVWFPGCSQSRPSCCKGSTRVVFQNMFNFAVFFQVPFCLFLVVGKPQRQNKCGGCSSIQPRCS